MFKNFQNRLAISPTSLYTIAVIMIAAWMVAPKGSLNDSDTACGIWYLMPHVLLHQGLINTLAAVLSATAVIFILGELNISQVLLRVNSRAISYTFAALMAASTCLHTFHPGMIVMLCFLMSFFTLFSSYQIDNSATLTYITFLYLGLSVLVFPKAIWMAPVYWLSLYILRAINPRSLCASLLGLLTPIWIVAGMAYITSHFSVFTGLLSQMVSFSWGGYSNLSTGETISIWICFIVFFIGFIDLRTRPHLDKTRTRILLLVAGIHGFAIYLLLLLQPQSIHILLPAAIIPTSIMGGHYVANDSTALSNTIVWVLTISIVVIFLLQTWML